MHDADELAALRARAYGRDADIFDDTAALHRLRELEEQAAGVREGGAGNGLQAGSPTGVVHDSGTDDSTRNDRADSRSSVAADGSAGFATTAGPSDADAESAPDETETGAQVRIRGEASRAIALDAAGDPDDADARPESTADAAASAEHPDSASSGSAPTEPRPFTRRLAALWAASVVAASVITGIVVATVIDYDPTVVATLHEAPGLGDPDWLEGLPISEGSVPPVQFEAYFGLTVLTFTWGDGVSTGSTNQPGSTAERRCIALAAGSDANVSAASAGGCSEGGLEAIAEFIVSPDSPEELQSVHEIGTTLRFAQDGDRVVVRAGSPD